MFTDIIPGRRSFDKQLDYRIYSGVMAVLFSKFFRCLLSYLEIELPVIVTSDVADAHIMSRLYVLTLLNFALVDLYNTLPMFYCLVC